MGKFVPVKRLLSPLMIILSIVGVLLVLAAGCGGDAAISRQAVVETRGATVMPFDQNLTMHHFVPSDSGGVEMVVVIDPSDVQQVDLIRSHLRDEAERFVRGDFSDPAAIHGAAMPGLSVLEAAGGRLNIGYGNLAGGAQISYASSDPAVIAAIHDWFAAQITDHGAHAMN